MSDYDNAPTHPHHGGKLMPHQMPQRIEELEADLRDYQQQVSKLEDELEEVEDSLTFAKGVEIVIRAERDHFAREMQRMRKALHVIADSYDARSELYRDDTDLAAGLADRARAAINPEGETP